MPENRPFVATPTIGKRLELWAMFWQIFRTVGPFSGKRTDVLSWFWQLSGPCSGTFMPMPLTLTRICPIRTGARARSLARHRVVVVVACRSAPPRPPPARTHAVSEGRFRRCDHPRGGGAPRSPAFLVLLAVTPHGVLWQAYCDPGLVRSAFCCLSARMAAHLLVDVRRWLRSSFRCSGTRCKMATKATHHTH